MVEIIVIPHFQLIVCWQVDVSGKYYFKRSSTWLRLPASSAGGLGSTSDQGTKVSICCVVQPKKKKKALDSSDTMKCNETFLYLIIMKRKQHEFSFQGCSSASSHPPSKCPIHLGGFCGHLAPRHLTTIYLHMIAEFRKRCLFTHLSERLYFLHKWALKVGAQGEQSLRKSCLLATELGPKVLFHYFTGSQVIGQGWSYIEMCLGTHLSAK